MPGWMVLIAVVAAISGGAAAARAQRPAEPANLKTFDFGLDGVRYRVALPAGATLMARSGSDRFHISLSTRMLRQMELWPASAETGRTYARSQSLANGAVLTFEVMRPSSAYRGGSGGPEETLEGQMRIGGRTLAVRCHDQAEWPGSPRPTWCIDYLQHLVVQDGR
ncbi:MAG TPA: hypothetical protein VFR73_12515 [Hyphomicrobiaceae bacterium]|nr:hypothetical protein [Hyphomicrobiaceae bacterium]